MELDDEVAEAVAGFATLIRGCGALGTTAAECRHVTPEFVATLMIKVLAVNLCMLWTMNTGMSSQCAERSMPLFP